MRCTVTVESTIQGSYVDCLTYLLGDFILSIFSCIVVPEALLNFCVWNFRICNSEYWNWIELVLTTQSGGNRFHRYSSLMWLTIFIWWKLVNWVTTIVPFLFWVSEKNCMWHIRFGEICLLFDCNWQFFIRPGLFILFKFLKTTWGHR